MAYLRSKKCLVCKKLVYARNFCRKHYEYNRKYGDPYIRPPIGAPRKGGLSWVKQHVNYRGRRCLLWPFPRSGSGYGQVRTEEGRRIGAHVFMCELVNGSAPSDQYEASHLCGRGKLGCVHPKHVIWETPSENNLRKRKHGTDFRGERGTNVKLTNADVIEIRKRVAAKEVQWKIGMDYGVGSRAISKIATRVTWRHI